MWSRRDMWLSYANIVSISSAVWAQCTKLTDKQTDHGTESSIAIGVVAFQRCPLIIIIKYRPVTAISRYSSAGFDWHEMHREYHFSICLSKSFTFDEDMRERRFLHVRYTWPWPLTFRPQICCLLTLVQRCDFANLEVSTAFLFRENRRHGTDRETDGRTYGTPKEDCIINR